jgi:hypothetical protein
MDGMKRDAAAASSSLRALVDEFASSSRIAMDLARAFRSKGRDDAARLAEERSMVFDICADGVRELSAALDAHQEPENANQGLRACQSEAIRDPEATPMVCASCGREYGHARNCAMPSAPRVYSHPVCNTAGCGCVATHGRHCQAHVPPEFDVDRNEGYL